MLQTLHKFEVKTASPAWTKSQDRPERSRQKTLTEKGKLVAHWLTDDQSRLYCQWVWE
ncbi:hypothetical protein [Lyngbya sp. CCY1209]|uniref:hypothetical protein n=1 Tax=Lyngbya sp. CCY1209 TaxID=2886103 RepID=UPI002D20F783|nr:hypothetical protein [Lyngbya sp. CCY1209]MEB3882223.1 hypothetical protein [Lyngbya sp. CCY1209]